ncbi:MAG: hypothetical protein ABFS16_16840, partial [Bacteroidota bacterium]
MKYKVCFLLFIAVFFSSSTLFAQSENEWNWGNYGDSTFIPITTYLQSTADIDTYKEAGFNVYANFWYGLTEQILSDLRAKNMHYLATWEKHAAWPSKEMEPDLVAQANIDDPLFIAWGHDDEPDNAQKDEDGNYIACVDPQVIIEKYNEIKVFDTTGRQVMLNCGAGVARTDAYIRGSCAGNTDMYTEYYKGCDIASYDIYPVASPPSPIETNNELWYVSQGVQNMREFTNDSNDAYWFNLECTEIGGKGLKPTPEQMWTEAWMGIVAGGTGFSWFPFTVSPLPHNPRALLEDPEMMAAVKKVNRSVHDLAVAINSETINNAIDVKVLPTPAPWDPTIVEVDYLVKHVGDTLYIFTAGGKGDVANTATFTIKTSDGSDITSNVIVMYQEREIEIVDNTFSQEYVGQEIHLFKIGGISKDILTSLDDTPLLADEKLKLEQNFPNPFNDETFITFKLSETTNIELAVYDLFGKKI